MGKHKKKALGRGLASLIEEESEWKDASTTSDDTAKADSTMDDAIDGIDATSDTDGAETRDADATGVSGENDVETRDADATGVSGESDVETKDGHTGVTADGNDDGTSDGAVDTKIRHGKAAAYSGNAPRAMAAVPEDEKPIGRTEDDIARQVDIRIARDWTSREDSLIHYSKRHDESTELTVTIPRLLLFASGAPLVTLSLVGVLGICRSFVRSGRS